MTNSNTLKWVKFFLSLNIILHLGRLITWGYPFSNSPENFRIPLISWVNIPPTIHLMIFGLFSITAILFCLKKQSPIISILISLFLSYFIINDTYSFHHDIILAIQIFFFYGCLLLVNKKHQSLIEWCIKALAVSIYGFAGLNKLSPEFLNGTLIYELSINGILYKKLIFPIINLNELFQTSSYLISYLVAFIELIIPVLLLNKRTKYTGLTLAIIMHASIALISNVGMLFNLYLPTLLIFFFKINQSPKTFFENFFKKPKKTNLEKLGYSSIALYFLVYTFNGLLLIAPLIIHQFS